MYKANVLIVQKVYKIAFFWRISRDSKKLYGLTFFTMRSHSIGETRFWLKWKTYFHKKLESPLTFIYFKMGKQVKTKPLKGLLIFWKSSLQKTWVSVRGSGYLSGRCLQRDSTPLSPNKVSIGLVEGNMTINQLIMNT